jgi:hypothetical protein
MISMTGAFLRTSMVDRVAGCIMKTRRPGFYPDAISKTLSDSAFSGVIWILIQSWFTQPQRWKTPAIYLLWMNCKLPGNCSEFETM